METDPRNIDISKLKQLVQSLPEISAAYLFGSAAENSSVVNDLDLLVLTSPEVNKDKAYFDIKSYLARELTISEEYIDLLFFDLASSDPEILYSALTNGILLKDKAPELLSENIERLSLFFLVNEPYIARSKNLIKEQLEEFCADQHRASTTVSGPDQT